MIGSHFYKIHVKTSFHQRLRTKAFFLIVPIWFSLILPKLTITFFLIRKIYYAVAEWLWDLKYIEYKNVGFFNIITVLITHEYKSVIYCKEYIIKSTFTWTYTSSKIYIYIQIQRINNVHVCDQTEMYMTPYIQYIQKINQDLVNP